jgi:hypothetical protein
VTRGLRAAVAAILLVAGAACGPSAEDVERDRVLRAIDALRDAPAQATEARRMLLDELERQPAVAAPAVLARDTCASAYRHMLDADATSRDIQRAVEAGEADRPDLPRKLAEAEANVAQAKLLMPACERALVELRRPVLRAR